MARTSARPGVPREVAALSVHGPAGVLDLTVPSGATFGEVAEAYARGASTPVPTLVSRTGRALQPQETLDRAGIASGSVLVALGGPPGAAGSRQEAPGHVPARPGRPDPDRPGPGRSSTGASIVLLVTVVLAVLAGWTGIQRDEDERWVVAAVLGAGALLGLVPLGRGVVRRVVAAPAFAAAACFVMVWDAVPERLPTTLGVAALAGAVAAAVGRSLTDPEAGSGEALRVWIVVGALWFLVATLAAIVGTSASVVWAVLLAVAVLAARIVPTLAVDVPDEYLLDLERLAVNAWSARDRPPGKRTRVVVPTRMVSSIAERGGRSLDAAAVAVLVVVAFAAPLLLLTATLPLDRIGARCLVGFGGGALLLAARGHRHRVARTALRIAGSLCFALLAGVAVTTWSGDLLVLLTVAVVALALGLVVLGVAVGRGWRSAWWSRRAEVAEVVCGAFTVASVVVAVGLFRQLWELTG